jgi:hypothetical protein
MLASDLARLARFVLGVSLVLLGLVLVSTLWLLPIGLPLTLLGIALAEAPDDLARGR